MPTASHTYQSTDLTTTRRRDFFNEALAGVARIRLPDGETLVTLPEQDLAVLTTSRTHFVGFLQLQSALSRKRSDRRAVDFGEFAWAAVLDEADLVEFVADLTDSLAVSLASRDLASVDETIRAWRLTAELYADVDARSRISSSLADFVDVPEPADASNADD